MCIIRHDISTYVYNTAGEAGGGASGYDQQEVKVIRYCQKMNRSMIKVWEPYRKMDYTCETMRKTKPQE